MALPDFPRIQESLQTVGTEISRLQHHPAFDNGAAILASLNQLQTTMNTRFGQMDVRFGQMEARFDARFDQMERQQRVS
jgi:hypothetical protein